MRTRADPCIEYPRSQDSQGLEYSETAKSVCRSEDRQELLEQTFRHSDFGQGKKDAFEDWACQPGNKHWRTEVVVDSGSDKLTDE